MMATEQMPNTDAGRLNRGVRALVNEATKG